MRAFLVWLGVSAVAWLGAAWGLDAHFEARPSTVLVVVDTSFAMTDAWPSVAPTLDRLDEERYARFALYSPRGPIHGAEAELQLGTTRAYGPRDLSDLPTFLPDAARRIVVTNAPARDLEGLNGWEIVRPD